MHKATLGKRSLGRPRRVWSSARREAQSEATSSLAKNVSCRCVLERRSFRQAKTRKGASRAGPQRAQSQRVEEQGEVKTPTRLGKAPPKTRGDYAPDGRSYLEGYDLTHCETTPMAGGGSSATSPPVISPIVVTKMIEAVAIGHFQKLSGDYSDVPRSKEMNELNLTFMLSRITFEFSDLPQRDYQIALRIFLLAAIILK